MVFSISTQFVLMYRGTFVSAEAVALWSHRGITVVGA